MISFFLSHLLAFTLSLSFFFSLCQMSLSSCSWCPSPFRLFSTSFFLSISSSLSGLQTICHGSDETICHGLVLLTVCVIVKAVTGKAEESYYSSFYGTVHVRMCVRAYAHLSRIWIVHEPSQSYCTQYRTAESCVTIRGEMFYLHIGRKRPLYWYLLVCILCPTKQPDFPSRFIHAEHYKSALSVLFSCNNGNIYWYYKDCSKRYLNLFFFLVSTCSSAKARYRDYSYLQNRTVIQKTEHGICIKGFSLPCAMRWNRIRDLFSYRSLGL